MTDSAKANKLSVDYYFPTAVYSVMKPEFLDSAREVCEEYIQKKRINGNPKNELYPNYISDSFFNDFRIGGLANYILNSSWDILNSQGYDMTNMRTFFNDLHCQDHSQHSMMEQHIHGQGAQIVGFYFIDCPENCSKVLFHDVRPGKVQIALPELDATKVTDASNIINYQPKEGLLMFTNAWLAHAFTVNGASQNMRFIHFTVMPHYVQTQASYVSAAEII